MRIGIISDTHGDVRAWRRAMDVFGDADLILHAGDVLYHPPRMAPAPEYDIPGLVELINSCPVPLVIARGNCDAEFYEEVLKIPALSPYALVQFGDLRIVVQHGHTLGPEGIGELADKYRASVVVTGHTHIPVIEQTGSAIHINPGSPAHPKFEREGVLRPTVGLIADGKAQIVELGTGNEIISLAL